MDSLQSHDARKIGTLISQLQDINGRDVSKDPDARHEALGIARKLVDTLEAPVNRATDLVFKPYSTIAARIAVDLHLFEHIAAETGPITSHDLASKTGGNEVLISRVLRLLAAVNLVEQPGPDQWTANDTTKAMALPAIAAGHRFVFDVLINSAMKAPKYLRESRYIAPSEPTDGFVQYANQTKQNIFQFLESMPSLFQDFNLFMGNTMGAREYWHEWYDVENRVLDGFNPESQSPNLLVDVGGGKGHDLIAFDKTFSNQMQSSHAQLVLQDLPPVLEGIPDTELPPSIVKMAHDFFTEQPIKGARGYFLHHILHDWSDKYCLLILEKLRRAMTPGYSKLLIHDLILPDTGAVEIQARFDLVMMTFNGGMERSRGQWVKLLEDAGFVNIKLHEHLDHDGIVEAET